MTFFENSWFQIGDGPLSDEKKIESLLTSDPLRQWKETDFEMSGNVGSIHLLEADELSIMPYLEGCESGLPAALYLVVKLHGRDKLLNGLDGPRLDETRSDSESATRLNISISMATAG